MAFRQTMKAGRKHAKKSRRASKRSRRHSRKGSRKSRRGKKGGNVGHTLHRDYIVPSTVPTLNNPFGHNPHTHTHQPF